MKVVTALCKQDRDLFEYQMNSEEWEQIKHMLSFLQPFAEVTSYMSGEAYPTVSSIIVFFNGIMDHLDSCENKAIYRKNNHLKIISRAAESANIKMKQYYNLTTNLHSVVTLLDPRCNMDFFEKKAKFTEELIIPILRR